MQRTWRNLSAGWAKAASGTSCPEAKLIPQRASPFSIRKLDGKSHLLPIWAHSSKNIPLCMSSTNRARKPSQRCTAAHGYCGATKTAITDIPFQTESRWCNSSAGQDWNTGTYLPKACSSASRRTPPILTGWAKNTGWYKQTANSRPIGLPQATASMWMKGIGILSWMAPLEQFLPATSIGRRRAISSY